MRVLICRSVSASHFQRRLRFCRAYCWRANNKNRRVNERAQLISSSAAYNSNQRSKFLVPTVVLVAVGAVTLLHYNYNDKGRMVIKGSHYGDRQGDGSATSNKPAFGGPFRLIDTAHHEVTEADMRGGWTLLYFGYSSSPDEGPEEVEKMAKAIDVLESRHKLKIKAVFITIDPQRDSPSQLRAYLEEFDPRIIGLTGSVDSIRQAALEYRVFFKKVEEEGADYLVATSHNMYLLNPHLEIVKCFTVNYNVEQLSEGILKEVRATV